MAGTTGRRVAGGARLRGGALIGAAALLAVSLILQILLPTWIPAAGLLNLPLLAAVFCMVASGSVVSAMILGTLVGWAYDGLTHGPLGAFGVVYAVLGYLAASAGRTIQVNIPAVLGLVVGLLYLAHELMAYAMHEFVLGGHTVFEPGLWLVLAALHGGAAVLAHPLLGRLG